MTDPSISKVDIDGIMMSIRREVAKRKSSIQKHSVNSSAIAPVSASSEAVSPSESPNLKALGYLYGTIAYAERLLNTSASRSTIREGLPGKFERFPLRLLRPLQRPILKIFNFLFKDQREVNANLIQSLRELFKVDRALLGQSDQVLALGNQVKALELQLQEMQVRLAALEPHVKPGLASDVQRLGHQITHTADQLETTNQQLTTATDQLETTNGQLEAATEQIEEVKQRFQASEQEELRNLDAEQQAYWDHFYLEFENAFRGDRSVIKQRQISSYADLLQPLVDVNDIPGVQHRAIDIGSGRGEWLEYLKDLNFAAYGVDINSEMSQQCEALGIEVVQSDGLSHLQALEGNYLSLISAFHVAEHLSTYRLVQLAQESFRVLQPGGIAIFETPNPENLSVGTCNFYLDPTHRNPLPPALLEFIFKFVGFEKVEIRRLNPVEQDHALFHPLLRTMFLGAQDYSVIAWKGREQDRVSA